MSEQASELIKQGISQYQARQFEAALGSWQEALALYRSMDDKRRSGAALGNMGVAYEALLDYAKRDRVLPAAFGVSAGNWRSPG